MKNARFITLCLVLFSWIFSLTSCDKNTGPTDSIAPTIVGIQPANGAQNVEINQSISVVFSEDMDMNSATEATFKLSSSTSNAISGTITVSKSTITFMPSAQLDYEKTYTVKISTGVKDLAGNPIESSYESTFTTQKAPDVTLPTVSSITPANAATDVPVNSKIIIVFSEAVMGVSSSSVILTESGTSNVIAATLDLSQDKTLTITPNANLKNAMAYKISLSNAINDLSGNKLAVVSYTFTTVALPEVNLPSDFVSNWYDSKNTWLYSISSDSNGKYIRTGNVLYYYNGTNVTTSVVSGTTVYKVEAKSIAGNAYTVWLKQGTDKNVLSFSNTSASTGFVDYYKVAPQVNLPATFLGNLYNLAGTWLFSISSDGTGNYFRTNNVLYYYTGYDVTTSVVNGNTVYQVDGKSTGGTAKTLWYYQTDNKNAVYISGESASTGFNPYYKVVARNLKKAYFNGGNYTYISGTNWNEIGTSTFAFTETSRDDWSVYLTKGNGDKIQLDLFYMKIYYTPLGGTKSELYTITSIE